MLTLRQFTYFASLCSTLSFRRAAERCHITQPALSMQIQELEATLGLKLVERGGGEIRLTDAGIEVRERAQAILAAVADLEEWAKQRQPLSGALRLGVIPSVAPYLLPAILPEVSRRYPSLRLHLRETQTAMLLDELLRRELDLVLLALPIDRPDVEVLPLFEDRFVLATGRAGTWTGSGPLEPEALDGEELLLLEEGHCLRDQALQYCRSVHQDVFSRFGATSLATILQMVANGYGVTLLPEIAVPVEVRDARIHLRRFCAPEPRRTLGLIWRKTSARRADAVALGQIAREVRGQVCAGAEEERQPAQVDAGGDVTG